MNSSPMAVPENGAMYCSAAGSAAEATTTMLCAIAPRSSRMRTVCATCACFSPTAT